MTRLPAALLALTLSGCAAIGNIGQPGAEEFSAITLRDIDQAIEVARGAKNNSRVICLQDTRDVILPLNDGNNALPGPFTLRELASAFRGLALQCVNLPIP